MRLGAVALTVACGLSLGATASSLAGLIGARHTVTLPPSAAPSAPDDERPACPPDAPWSDEAAACFAPSPHDAPRDRAADATGVAEAPDGPHERPAEDAHPTPAAPAQAPSQRTDDGAPGEAAEPARRETAEATIPDPLPMVARGPDGRRLVRRDAVEAFLRDESAVRRNAPQRTVPHFDDGVLVGYRLEGLGLGSVYTDLGIRDGDTIVRVNGTFIDSPQRGWALFAGLQQTQTFVVEVQRRGHDRVLRFDVVDDDGMRAWFEGSGDVPF